MMSYIPRMPFSCVGLASGGQETLPSATPGSWARSTSPWSLSCSQSSAWWPGARSRGSPDLQGLRTQSTLPGAEIGKWQVTCLLSIVLHWFQIRIERVTQFDVRDNSPEPEPGHGVWGPGGDTQRVRPEKKLGSDAACSQEARWNSFWKPCKFRSYVVSTSQLNV